MDSASRARLSPGTGSTVGARFALDAEAPVEDPPTTGAGATAVPSAPCVLNETAPAGVSQARANKTHDSRRTTRALPLTVSTSRLKGPRQALAFLPFLSSSFEMYSTTKSSRGHPCAARLSFCQRRGGSPASACGHGRSRRFAPAVEAVSGISDPRLRRSPPTEGSRSGGGNGRPEAKGRRSADRFPQAR